MQFRVALVKGPFLVLDAAKIDVGRASLLLRTSRVSWVVLVYDKKYFVLPAAEFRKNLNRKKSTALLSEALPLGQLPPSQVFTSANQKAELDQRPHGGGPVRRAVILRKHRSGQTAISAIGELVSAPSRLDRVRPGVRAMPVKRAPERRFLAEEYGGLGRKSNARRSPAKKAASKAAAKKDGAYKGTGRLRGLTAISADFSFGLMGRSSRDTPAPVVPQAANSFEIVDVLYATDRERKATGEQSSISGFLNRLPEKAQLSYGICHVTVPKKHTLGNVEAPSVWTFWAEAKSSKHFTIKGYSERSSSTFIKELHDRVDGSVGKSCFIFIHGYNVSFVDAAKRTAQLSCDLKFLGVPILYSWASAADPRRYSKDEDTVSMTVKRLTAFLAKVLEVSGAEQIHLIAHSMGNRALVNALERLTVSPDSSKKPFKQVVLTAPDVPRKDVEPLIKAASDKAERVTLYASKKDKALGLSQFKHKYERLGKVYGYPYVLEGMDSIDASKVRTDFWGHTVVASTRTVLGDLAALVADGKPPDRRFGLLRLKSPGGVFWAIQT